MKIGFSEIIIIFVVALIVIGPDKLPAYAKKLGEALREFRNVSNDLTKDLKETVIEPLEEAQKPIKEAIQPMTEVTNDIKKNIDDVRKSVNDIGKPTIEKSETTKNVDASADNIVADNLNQNETSPEETVKPVSETVSQTESENMDHSETLEMDKSDSEDKNTDETVIDKTAAENKFETVGHYRV